MKILIDIGHPAHVHYFRNLAELFVREGSDVLFTTRDKEVAVKLLNHFGLKYVNFGKPFKSRIGKLWGLFWFTLRLFLVAVRFKPDIYLNATQYSAFVAWLFRKPHISLEDTFNSEQVRLFLPFTSVVLTGNYNHPDLGRKQITYSGYQELAYLHPLRFKPDPRIKSDLGIGPNERYVILRFIAWKASHDFGSRRLTLEQKGELIRELEKAAVVFISSEADLPVEFTKYRLNVPPHKIHDVLAFASLYVGEGATMASECAMLGTPAIYINQQNQQDRYYICEQEQKYGLIFSHDNIDAVIKKSTEMLANNDVKKTFNQKRDQMLADKIDVTAFLVWFVERYPESLRTMRKNPEYQLKFKASV